MVHVCYVLCCTTKKKKYVLYYTLQGSRADVVAGGLGEVQGPRLSESGATRSPVADGVATNAAVVVAG